MVRSRARTPLLSLATVAVLAAALLIPSSAMAERTIALSTGAFDLALAPGQSSADRIGVANNGDEPLTALVYTADVKADETGEQTYVRPGPDLKNFLTSPASWVRVKVPDSTKIVANTPYLEMAPGQELPVDFELVVPRNAPPGDYNVVVFFEMFEFSDGDEGAISRVSGRIGSRIDLRVVGDVIDKVVVGPFVAQKLVIGDKASFSTKVTNDGNIDKKITVDLKLVGEGEEQLWSKRLDKAANLYAKQDRLYDGTVAFKGVGFGKYTFRTQVEYQRELGDEARTLEPVSENVDRTIWIIPLWLAILIILLVGLPLLYLTYRASTIGIRRKLRDAEKAANGDDDDQRADDEPVSRPRESAREGHHASRAETRARDEERRREREERRASAAAVDADAIPEPTGHEGALTESLFGDEDLFEDILPEEE